MPTFLHESTMDGLFADNTALEAQWIDDQTLTLNPWPLDVPQLKVAIAARQLPAGKYRSAADLERVYEQSQPKRLSFVLQRQ